MQKQLVRRDFLKVSGIGLAGIAGASLVAGCAPQQSKSEDASTVQADVKDAVKVKVAFFSPTNGTRNAVGALAESISAKPDYYDLTPKANRQKDIEFANDELAIVAAPSMGGRLASVQGLLTNLKGNDTPAVVLAAFGNRNYDDLLAQMKGILGGQGFKVIGAIAIVTPHVFSEKAGHNRPNAEDRDTITAFAKEVVARFKESPSTEAVLPGNPTPEIKPLKVAEKIYDAEKCTKCGRCAENYPVEAIDPKDVSQVNSDLCINCQRCTYSCNYYGRSYDPSPVRAFIESNCLAKKEIETFI